MPPGRSTQNVFQAALLIRLHYHRLVLLAIAWVRRRVFCKSGNGVGARRAGVACRHPRRGNSAAGDTPGSLRDTRRPRCTAGASPPRIICISIFPACYAGRWSHSHFAVYPSPEQATAASNALHTSQLALSEDGCTVAYQTSDSERGVKNPPQTALDRDNVFVTDTGRSPPGPGNPTAGYTARRTVGLVA